QAAVEGVDGRVLEQEDPGRELDPGLDDLDDRPLGGGERLPGDEGALDVLVAAEGVEAVLLVAVEGRLVAQPLPHRVRVLVDEDVVGVVLQVGHGCSSVVTGSVSSRSTSTTSPSAARILATR